jgi:hypothetical protein
MKLVLSGEGKTDIGEDTPGPIAEMLFALLHSCGAAWNEVMILHRAEITRRSKQLKPMRLPRAGEQRETALYHKNARAFAQCALEQAETVIGFLMRDCDGNPWQRVYASMLDGFAVETFSTGVPVVPTPVSEAWVLCATQNNYQHCARLEAKRGKTLKRLLPSDHSAEMLTGKVRDGEIDATQIDMPSFNRCKERLLEVVRLIHEETRP